MPQISVFAEQANASQNTTSHIHALQPLQEANQNTLNIRRLNGRSPKRPLFNPDDSEVPTCP